jgi:hypothetical protein
MTLATVSRRYWLPALNLTLAGAAVALGIVAIVTDDVTANTAGPAAVVAPAVAGPKVPIWQTMPSGWPATEAMRRDAEARSVLATSNAPTVAEHGSVAAIDHRDQVRAANAMWRVLPSGWPATEAMRRAAEAASGAGG